MVEWKQFRKKPLTIDAFQVDQETTIETLEGIMTARPGDWIVRGIKGEQYPVKDEIFRLSYDPITDTDVVEELDLFDKELIKMVNDKPEGIEQVSIFWNYGDVDDSFISYRLKCLARDGRIKRVSSHNHVVLYPVLSIS